MNVEFDPAKDRANLAKHGVSLARAADWEFVAVITEERVDYGEPRFIAFGLLDSLPHCLAFAVRGGAVRAISPRRAHKKEFDRYVGSK